MSSDVEGQLAGMAAFSAAIAAVSWVPAGPVSFEAKLSTFVARFWSAVRAAVMSPEVSAVRRPLDSCVSELASSAVRAFEV